MKEDLRRRINNAPAGTFKYETKNNEQVPDEWIKQLINQYIDNDLDDDFPIEVYIKQDVPDRDGLIRKLKSLRSSPIQSTSKNTDIDSIEIAESVEISRFENCHNLDDIFFRLKERPIKSSDGSSFGESQLNKGIEKIRTSNYTDFTGITRTEKLRYYVAKFMIIEAQNYQQVKNILMAFESLVDINGRVYPSQELQLGVDEMNSRNGNIESDLDELKRFLNSLRIN